MRALITDGKPSASALLMLAAHWAARMLEELEIKVPDFSGTQKYGNNLSIGMHNERSRLFGSADLQQHTGALEALEVSSPEFSGVYKDQQLINRPCFNLPKRECLHSWIWTFLTFQERGFTTTHGSTCIARFGRC